MSLAENASLTVEFEGATVVPLADISSLQRAYRIGWFVPKVDVDAASSRYRCLHFAHALRPLFHSVYLTSLSDVQSAVHDLDAIIIVKRLDRTVLDVVGVARLFDVPVFLDLCDDLIAPGYSKNDFGTNLLHFLGIAPFLAGVTASSAEMADRLEGYARENGCSRLSVHVVPDIAETREIYEATSTALRGRTPSQDDEPHVFGMLRQTLADLLPQLGQVGFTHAWGGPLGIARDWAASVGLDRGTGLAWAGGYVGDGVGTSNLAGRTLADLVLGRDTELATLPWVDHRSRRWEPEPLRWIGINAGLRAMRLADWEEGRTGRPSRVARAMAPLIHG